jgi:alpha/beta superfamily hydrolase
MKEDIFIPFDNLNLNGILTIPSNAIGIVLFAHGSGSSRLSKRNQFVAEELNKNDIATLLFDLLTSEEEEIDLSTAQLRFDIDLLTQRLIIATKWIKKNTELQKLPIGYFGASTGAAAAICAGAKQKVQAIVSRGGRPDLAMNCLSSIDAPTLFIVGGNDEEVFLLNKKAYENIHCEKKMMLISGATHLFDEKGKLEEVAKIASNWFVKRFVSCKN